MNKEPSVPVPWVWAALVAVVGLAATLGTSALHTESRLTRLETAIEQQGAVIREIRDELKVKRASNP